MPKEVIYGSELPYGEDDPGRSVVEVGWSRDGVYVQLATKCVHAADETDYHPPLEPFQGIVHSGTGEPVTDGDVVVGELLEVEGLARSGHYVQLDRTTINELIRTLRRARDQAFGRDE